ncbi:hypothetical protein CDAR_203661 [Caerostris darwini]|uniref:Uncharacterized protein n=1 Tax=Caerostris darwini TaxID=1538125 RepID=A0AAV4RYH3_9ARAC|nr:hypothetical protein CDAR_203661 [Caerostris darwini]
MGVDSPLCTGSTPGVSLVPCFYLWEEILFSNGTSTLEFRLAKSVLVEVICSSIIVTPYSIREVSVNPSVVEFLARCVPCACLHFAVYSASLPLSFCR